MENFIFEFLCEEPFEPWSLFEALSEGHFEVLWDETEIEISTHKNQKMLFSTHRKYFFILKTEKYDVFDSQNISQWFAASFKAWQEIAFFNDELI